MLEATGVDCVRGERCLFQQFDLLLRPGQCVHVIGPNGAGKTSLLRILAGLLAPAAGSVRWKGREVARNREPFAADLAFVGHRDGIKDELSAIENVRFEGALRGADPGLAGAAAALARLGMTEHTAVPVGKLSQGQRRRVALSRLCQAARPPLWILDEPYNGLDTASAALLDALLREQLADDGIVVLTAHQTIRLPPGSLRVELGAPTPGGV